MEEIFLLILFTISLIMFWVIVPYYDFKNRFIDLNGMPTRLGLFYAESVGNRVHCTFIFTFLAIDLEEGKL